MQVLTNARLTAVSPCFLATGSLAADGADGSLRRSDVYALKWPALAHCDVAQA